MSTNYVPRNISIHYSLPVCRSVRQSVCHTYVHFTTRTIHPITLKFDICGLFLWLIMYDLLNGYYLGYNGIQIPHPVCACAVHIFLYRNGTIGGINKKLEINCVVLIHKWVACYKFDKVTNSDLILKSNGQKNSDSIFLDMALTNMFKFYTSIKDYFGHNVTWVPCPQK